MTYKESIQRPGLKCFKVDDAAPRIVPAKAERAWMDETGDRFAYRCIPLSVANSSGWELLCPSGFVANWSGGENKKDIEIKPLDGEAEPRFVSSHFGHGILTLHPGYIFQTPTGWAVWVRGSPNASKNDIAPLDGLVETDWLPFTFTMNWRFTRPGSIRFDAGEPFCFITLFPHALIDDVQPELLPLSTNPDLERQFVTWKESRLAFNKKLAANEPEAREVGWQKNYAQGKNIDGTEGGFHLSRRRLKQPKQV